MKAIRRAPEKLYVLVFADTRKPVCAIDGCRDLGLFQTNLNHALEEAARQEKLYDLDTVAVLEVAIASTRMHHHTEG